MALSVPKKRPNPFVSVQSVPMGVLLVTIACSWIGMIASVILGYPLWVIGLVTVLPWIPILFAESLWKYKHYKWFALFGVLILTQCLHFVEHIAQIVEVDIVGWPRLLSTGILGSLDLEIVHFTFDTVLLIMTTILLFGKFRWNIPLWIAWVVAIWHTAEHWYITYFFLFDYKNYLPPPAPGLHGREGLLGAGGLLWPGSPFQRIELHFIYNLLYTVPLVWAFILVMRRAYDEYLEKAFPRLTEAQLAGLNNNMETVQVETGQMIVRQGDPADKFYIISSGEVEVLQGTGGPPLLLNRLKKGQFFGEVGLLTGAPRNASVRAVTRCELLALDRETFRAVIGNSAPTAQDYAQVMAQRSVPSMAAVSVGMPVAMSEAGSGPSFPQAGNPGTSLLSDPGFRLPGSPPSGPSFPQVSNPGFAGAAPAPPPGGMAFQNVPGNVVEGLTLVSVSTSGPAAPPSPDGPYDAKTVIPSTPPNFRDAASGWAYGLLFTDGQLKGRGVVLSADRMQVGRDVGNEIRISDDPQVSRRHAELLRVPSGGFQIRDLRSSNGVFVNGQRLATDESRLLQENDEVKVGSATFALRKVGMRVV